MAVGHSYELLDIQTVTGASNPVINRYYYQHVAGGGLGAANLATAFVEQVLPQVIAIQTAAVVHTEIRVSTPDDESDFISMPLSSGNTGTQAGETLPGFCVVKVKLHRPFTSFRNGSKAYSGVPEAAQNAGTISSIYLDIIETLCASLVETISPAGVSEDFSPVLIKNFNSAPPIRVVAQVMQASYTRIGTQNTRK